MKTDCNRQGFDIEPKAEAQTGSGNGLVSIILPTHNRASLLPQAIQSVLKQSYTNWELIIWNDGSTDQTVEVVNGFKDPRIRVFSELNRGKSFALNQGLCNAQGNLIAFLDDDDEWLPDKLAHQLAFVTAHPEIDLVFGDFSNVNHSSGNRISGFEQCRVGLQQLKTNSYCEDWFTIEGGFLDGISKEDFIAFDSAMIKKVVFSLIGNFDESLKNGEDFEFWWRFGLGGFLAAFTKEIVMIRNKYTGSLSGVGEKSIQRFLLALDTCKDDAIKAGRQDCIHFLDGFYRNQWQNLIKAYGQQGRKSEAFQAFLKSLQYGIQLGSVRLLLKALISIK